MDRSIDIYVFTIHILFTLNYTYWEIQTVEWMAIFRSFVLKLIKIWSRRNISSFFASLCIFFKAMNSVLELIHLSFGSLNNFWQRIWCKKGGPITKNNEIKTKFSAWHESNIIIVDGRFQHTKIARVEANWFVGHTQILRWMKSIWLCYRSQECGTFYQTGNEQRTSDNLLDDEICWSSKDVKWSRENNKKLISRVW